MPGIRDHKVWEITYTVEVESQRTVEDNMDKWEKVGTGHWYPVELSMYIVAPDNEQLVLAWFHQYTRHHVGRNKQVMRCEPHMLTAFIQDHQY